MIVEEPNYDYDGFDNLSYEILVPVVEPKTKIDQRRFIHSWPVGTFSSRLVLKNGAHHYAFRFETEISAILFKMRFS